MSSDLVAKLKKCDPKGPTVVQITKLYNTTDAQSFRAFGRVISGTVKKGMEIKVLGESYSPEDEEDMMKAVVEDIWIGESRSVSKDLICTTGSFYHVDMFSLPKRLLQEI